MAEDDELQGAGAERTRSEYRLALPVTGEGARLATARLVAPEDCEATAALMLDAYRGTIDDEGETMVEALDAAEFLITTCERPHSWILDGDRPESPLAVCIVNRLDDLHYVNLIAVAAAAKRRGLGRALVVHALTGLYAGGCVEVGAAITDGNRASERLFASIGATRRGPWPPAEV